MNEITYEQLTQATAEDAAGMAALVPQMTKNVVEPLNQQRLAEILATGTQVWVARDGEKLAGVGALGVLEVLVGGKYWIEDLVVDEAYRGQGIANEIMNRMLAAVPDDAYSVNLSSRGERPEAQAWYQRLGFAHESNVYRRRPLQAKQAQPE